MSDFQYKVTHVLFIASSFWVGTWESVVGYLIQLLLEY